MTTPSTSLQKACRLLRALTDARNSRLTDLALAAGVDKASALRLLETLAAEGLVHRDPATKAFAPGPEWLALHAATLQRTDLRPLVRPALIRLANAFEDSAILSVPSGCESVCIELRLGTFPIRANYLDIGSRRPLGIGAGSLALLAALPDAEIDAVLDGIAPAMRRYPRFSRDMLLGHVQATRERGYAVLLDVVVERMGGIAVALPGPGGYPLGAISIAALNDRITTREAAMARALRREADAICQHWRSHAGAHPDTRPDPRPNLHKPATRPRTQEEA
ncbi:transcriptional regulator [Cupriavidus sp. TA19]|uniref:IclR family transcriptional regulator n=1 Tax=unclassified Cupriavidus TaxID=2640874 RepID=UPI000E2EEA30|nr:MULTISPECIES: helix-turn-helix domain-containing protein [unclassified Cupriavidus]BDB26926.1 helix-turn-helix domain-containing protein [Cupriavidus sp. P-10]GLC97174.1 transcriptional regulator [Cupriavidus sp. TA19]